MTSKKIKTVDISLPVAEYLYQLQKKHKLPGLTKTMDNWIQEELGDKIDQAGGLLSMWKEP